MHETRNQFGLSRVVERYAYDPYGLSLTCEVHATKHVKDKPLTCP